MVIDASSSSPSLIDPVVYPSSDSPIEKIIKEKIRKPEVPKANPIGQEEKEKEDCENKKPDMEITGINLKLTWRPKGFFPYAVYDVGVIMVLGGVNLPCNL